MTLMKRIAFATLVFAVVSSVPSPAHAQAVRYKVLATSKTSTMEKELNDAGELGYQLQSVMGGETALGGKEAVAVMAKTDGTRNSTFKYLLLATSKTSTMQKELSETGAAGFEFVGFTVGSTAMGGSELVTITRRKVQ